MPPPSKSAPATKYQQNEKVLCFHGPLMYEAKVLKVNKYDDPPRYFVHYSGWNSKWDELVPEHRMVKINAVSLARQQELRKLHGKKGDGTNTPSSLTPPVSDSRSKTSHKASSGRQRASSPTDSVGSRESTATPSASVKSEASTSRKRKAGGRPSEVKSMKKGPGSTVSGSSAGKRTPTPSSLASSGRMSPPQLLDDPADDLPLLPQPGVQTEEEYLATCERRPEANVPLTDQLQAWLVDDWALVFRQMKLVRLPCKPNVDSILADYVEDRAQAPTATIVSKAVAKELSSALKYSFNEMLGSQLLYKFERPQFVDLMAKSSAVSMSGTYGASHLLRLLSCIGQQLATTFLDEDHMTQLVDEIRDFVKWFSRKSSKYFSHEDYIAATPDYQRRTITNS